MSIGNDELIARNAGFAAAGAFSGVGFPTHQTLRVLGCVDSRVDPSQVLGLELGEAVVMRNIGGRVTPSVLRSWGLLGRLGQPAPHGETGALEGESASGRPHLVVLHHTDCGIRRLTAYPEQLAEFFEVPVGELDAKAIDDPHAAVRIDVEIARRALPPGQLVTGVVYDTQTGLIEVVDPPTGA
jgi:carbonic anhydrase